MFERIKKLIKTAKKQAVHRIDPEIFNHPLAKQVEWQPLKSGGTNFQTHRLDSSNPDFLVFKASTGAYLFSGIFVFFGLLGMLIPLIIFLNEGQKEWGLVLFAVFFGGIFLAAGVFMFYFMTTPRVFDTFYGCFYQGRKKPKHNLGMSASKKHALTHLNEVKAIQLLRERIRSKNGSYYSYEINLVLRDASRVNVIDHGKHQAIIEDAETLAHALGVPLWDGS